MKRAAKVDANQAEIVAAIRVRGASVTHLHAVGAGVPDLLVGFCHQNFLFEIKDGAKIPSQRQLTNAQLKWHSEWKGSAYIVETTAHAIAILNEIENTVNKAVKCLA